MVFARHSFELSELQEDGESLLVHLEAVWEKSGVPPKQLADAPELSSASATLWTDFLELHQDRLSRNNGLGGVSRITWRDIADWERAKRVQLEAWERDAIRAVDDMWLSDFAPKPKEGGE